MLYFFNRLMKVRYKGTIRSWVIYHVIANDSSQLFTSKWMESNRIIEGMENTPQNNALSLLFIITYQFKWV